MKSSAILLLLAVGFSGVLASNPARAQTEPPFLIGFGCCRFYSAAIGTPAFMPREDLWVYALQDLEVSLLAPSERSVTTRSFQAQSSARLYTFTSNDEAGVWTIRARTSRGESVFPVFFVSEASPSALQELDYSLGNSELEVKGTVRVEGAHEGGAILLTRRVEAEVSSETETPFKIGTLRLRVTVNPLNPRNITLVPYAPSMTGPNQTMVWAEASLDVPLIKLVGRIPLITQVTELIAATHRTQLALGKEPSQGLLLTLPEPHRVGQNGDVPLRFGRGTLTFYLQVDRVIYPIRVNIYYLPQGLSPFPASESQVAPLANQIPFRLADRLANLGRYEIVLVVRVNGVETLWASTVVPPVARVNVYNELSRSFIRDYLLTSPAFQDAVNVEGQTYVLLGNQRRAVTFELKVAGVTLLDSDLNPSRLDIEPTTTHTITVKLSSISVRVTDLLGNQPSSGKLTVQRVTSTGRIMVLEQSWTTAGLVNITLPTGLYRFAAEIDGSQREIEERISLSNELVVVRFDGTLFRDSQNILTVAGIGAVIIIAELLVARRVWRNALQKPKTDQRESGAT